MPASHCRTIAAASTLGTTTGPALWRSGIKNRRADYRHCPGGVGHFSLPPKHPKQVVDFILSHQRRCGRSRPPNLAEAPNEYTYWRGGTSRFKGRDSSTAGLGCDACPTTRRSRLVTSKCRPPGKTESHPFQRKWARRGGGQRCRHEGHADHRHVHDRWRRTVYRAHGASH
jgi:hypothetical protein